jgi:DNA-binding transcriptional regulator YdaS (Cro superfamily)
MSLSPEQLRDSSQYLFGGYGWQTRLAEALGVDGSTVRRWVSGAVPVPNVAGVAITALVRVKELEAQLNSQLASPLIPKPATRHTTENTKPSE